MQRDPSGREPSPRGETQLSPGRAFVVQLTDDADPAVGQLEGRIEHLRSGRRIRFASSSELLEAFTSMVADTKSSLR